jgi:Tfp pilus assembly pilus retraction ATPase PilT
MAAIDGYLSEILERRGSDLHFIAGDPPRIRQYGDLMPLRPDKLDPTVVRESLYEIMPKIASRPRKAPISPTPWAIAGASASMYSGT